LVDYAKENKAKVESSDEIIEIIKELPDTKYHNMADIEKELGESREELIKAVIIKVRKKGVISSSCLQLNLINLPIVYTEMDLNRNLI
jgi:hypothetical protein